MNTTGKQHKVFKGAGRLAPLAALALALPLLTFEGKAQTRLTSESKTIEGRVRSLTAAPMGEVDGAVLEDGTVIHWPPHLADRFTAVVAKGERVRVVGRMETGPAGDTHLGAETATNIRTNASAENDDVPPHRAQGPGRPPGPP